MRDRNYNSRQERRDRWEKRLQRTHTHGHIWTGVLLLLIGTVALLRSYVPEFPRWVFSWQMLLISLGLFIGLRHRFHGVAWFVLMLIGGTFLANDYFLDGTLRRNLWPVLLIIIGIFFIIRSRVNPNRFCGDDEKKNPGNTDDSLKDPFSAYTKESYSQDDFIDTTSIFGGTKKIVLSKNFKGGDVVNVFGGTELNLTQSDINGTAVLELTTIFGGTKLIIPSHWRVKSEAVTIFGGIEDKRQLPAATTEVSDKTLVLKGTVIFGGIDIKSF